MNPTITNHIKRINQSINFIEENLNEDLDLNRLAAEASYSPFHYHRLFKALKGESPVAFLRRKRIEKIAWLLLKDKRLSVAEVVRRYGFDNDAAFSKAFKKFYGISATELRNMSTSEFNKINRTNSKNGKEAVSVDEYFAGTNKLKEWMQQTEVHISPANMEEHTYMTLRSTGDWELSDNAFLQLDSMVKDHSIPRLEFPWGLIIHDNPAITEENKVSHSAGFRISDKSRNLGNEETVSFSIPRGRYLVGRFKIKDEDFKFAWGAMSISVMEQDLTYRDGIYFERFIDDSVLQTDQVHGVELCIPID